LIFKRIFIFGGKLVKIAQEHWLLILEIKKIINQTLYNTFSLIKLFSNTKGDDFSVKRVFQKSTSLLEVDKLFFPKTTTFSKTEILSKVCDLVLMDVKNSFGHN
jgi:adenylate cyclase